MPRRRLNKGTGAFKEVNRAPTKHILQARGDANLKTSDRGPGTICCDSTIEDIGGIKSILEVENCKPSTSATLDSLSTNTAALYDELDSFRQRWKRELGETKQSEVKVKSKPESDCNRIGGEKSEDLNGTKDNKTTAKSLDQNTTTEDSSDPIYAKAKKLFLFAVELEQDEMHHESIRYYKQAMHLCPDIEKQIFHEQCEASAKAQSLGDPIQIIELGKADSVDDGCEKVQLYERIHQSYCENSKNERYTHCRPGYKPKSGTLHISDLPHELIMQIYRYVIGEELDLASLESTGLVCRGFYLLSKDPSLWKSICFSTWGNDTLTQTAYGKGSGQETKDHSVARIDWRQMFLDRPRVNYDGVYISRTRYIRQGEIGFQDITYRPFHVIRYYRYLRFFPDKRVLILTTNEEPDKIVPIFRHALHSKQFSPELSIMEGTFEFVDTNQINIMAEKDCRASMTTIQNQRRQAQFHWSRQTPLTQKFNLKFELKTVENKPHKNNVLKWLDYTILTRLETGQEITSFDIAPDNFPNLIFSRVRRFNLRLTNPLSSSH